MSNDGEDATTAPNDEDRDATARREAEFKDIAGEKVTVVAAVIRIEEFEDS